MLLKHLGRAYVHIRSRIAVLRKVYSKITLYWEIYSIQVPGINQEDLIKFDNKILCTATSFGEKAKKDMFKKLISELIGKDVAKLFKKEIVIKNLPSLVPAKVNLLLEAVHLIRG